MPRSVKATLPSLRRARATRGRSRRRARKSRVRCRLSKIVRSPARTWADPGITCGFSSTSRRRRSSSAATREGTRASRSLLNEWFYGDGCRLDTPNRVRSSGASVCPCCGPPPATYAPTTAWRSPTRPSAMALCRSSSSPRCWVSWRSPARNRRSSSSSAASLRERPSSCLIGGAVVCPATDRFDRQDLLHQAHDAARGADGDLASAHRVGLAAQGDAILTDIATITGLLARPTRRHAGREAGGSGRGRISMTASMTTSLGSRVDPIVVPATAPI
jgi:hypothetical protein